MTRTQHSIGSSYPVSLQWETYIGIKCYHGRHGRLMCCCLYPIIIILYYAVYVNDAIIHFQMIVIYSRLHAHFVVGSPKSVNDRE